MLSNEVAILRAERERLSLQINQLHQERDQIQQQKRLLVLYSRVIQSCYEK